MTAGTSTRRSWGTRLLIAAAIVLAYFIGTLRPMVQMHTGVAHSAEGAITLEADGWSYGVGLDGVFWTDTAGALHDNGRPDCLPPTGTTELVRFGAVDVTINGTSWRQVVWVDCR